MILAPGQWWAIGTLTGKRKLLRVRCLRCGRLAARYEKRAGEVIVLVSLSVPVPRPRRGKDKRRVSDAEREGEVA